MKVSLYDNDSLDEIIEMGTQNQSVDEWAVKCLAGISAMVKNKPLEYRTFGIFWWPVKQILVDAGLMAGTVNIEQVGVCTTGDKNRDIAGALAYHEHCAINFLNSNSIIVSGDEGGSDEYLLIDDELESVAAIGRL